MARAHGDDRHCRNVEATEVTVLVGSAFYPVIQTIAARKSSGAAKGKRFFGSGRYNMPGAMMTKAGKRRQMQMDVNRASPRRGKRR